MIKFYLISVYLLAISFILNAQPTIPLPEYLMQSHPRLLTNQEDRPVILDQIRSEVWAQSIMNGILDRINPYVEKVQGTPDWLSSRLMMYWVSRSTNV
jgi:hypothetical protein